MTKLSHVYAQLLKDEKIDEEDLFGEDFLKFEQEKTDVFEGEYAEGERHGYGVEYDGDRCSGEFVQGEMHGKGECVFKDGSSYRGQWAHDAPNGEGVWINSEDKPDEEWKKYKLFEGTIQAGKKHNGILYGWNGDALAEVKEGEIREFREGEVEMIDGDEEQEL